MENIDKVEEVPITTIDDAESAEYYWSIAVTTLENEVPAPLFSSWVKPLKPYAVSNDSFIIVAPEETTKSTVEQRYLTIITRVIHNVTGCEYNVRLITPDDIDENGEIKLSNKNKESMNGTNLRSRYVFESFVRGKSNEMAYAASKAVAEAPGKTTYNPLFLYGGVGLGKTHLMHSIGNYILNLDPECKVLYTTSENMTNEFIASLLERKNQEFRDKYRKIDVLLIDDIQFLTDKEGTQEEFFHTFNALYNDSKQIVISSDRPPIELKTLEERLRSRFGCGLIADIIPPDFETRTAILQKKAELENIKLPKEVLRHIAKNISSNIRELEGALIRVSAQFKSENKISLDLVDQALKDMIRENVKHEVTVDFIQKIVGDYYDVTPEEMKSKKRTQNIVFARHVAMYIARMIMGLGLIKVGQEFGGRDHTTVIHACNKITEELDQNPNFKDSLILLEAQINADPVN